jgi:hypothetical protein
MLKFCAHSKWKRKNRRRKIKLRRMPRRRRLLQPNQMHPRRNPKPRMKALTSQVGSCVFKCLG